MINFFILIFLFLTYSSQGTTLDQLWLKGLKERELNPKNQSYCYINRQGQIIGQNVTNLLPIGSISKIFTSLMALDRYGINYQFKTLIMYQPQSQWIHFIGGKDPLMAKRQLWYILSQLNKIGIKSVKKLSFDENFNFFPNLFELTSYEHRDEQKNQTILGPIKLNDNHMKQFIEKYAKTNHFSSETLQQYQALRKKFPSYYLEKINFSANDVSFVSSKNFNQLPSNEWIKIFEFQSAPLINILKYINSYSNNPAADLLYQALNGSSGQVLALLKKLNLIQDDSKKIDFYTGSGIPLTILTPEKSTRLVNRCSCQLTVLTMAKIHRLLNHSYDLPSPQIFPLPLQGELLSTAKMMPINSKEGTLRSYYQLPQTFIGKTGTLRLNKTLSLSQNTFSGIRHATFLGQSNNSADRIFLTQLYQQMLYQMSIRFDGAKKIPIDQYFFDQLFISMKE